MADWRDLRDLSVADLASERFKPKTDNQARYFAAIQNATVTICTGPPGSGKSYIPCGLAVQMLRSKQISRVILTRPVVPCGKGLGYLPGDEQAKILPYMRPVLDALHDHADAAELRRHMELKTIEIIPLDHMRGMSIKQTLVICDEAQNADFEQLHMLVTRLDHGTRIVVSGDANQSDLPGKAVNPLLDLIHRFTPPHRDMRLVQLAAGDVMRPEIVTWMDDRCRRAAGVEASGRIWYDINCPACGVRAWFSESEPEYVRWLKCHGCGTTLHDDGESAAWWRPVPTQSSCELTAPSPY
jgi:phosphate starvation-inducible PhoH-like protein